MAEIEIQPTFLSGLYHATRVRKGDARGFFSRFFDAGTFSAAGWPGPVVQINHTRTDMVGTVRGLHFQHAPHEEWKFVSCLAGQVFDVAVDLRPHSRTYGQWFGTVLSAENGESLLIPAGFAHGFQTLVPDCELLYLHSALYTPSAEGGLDACDPGISIAWPLAVSVRSDRDAALPVLANLKVPR